MRRICRAIGVFSPPIAALTVLAVGYLSPGYDPITRTVSRLAVPGMAAATATDVAIGLVAFACLAVAFVVREPGRAALAVAGTAFMVAAFVHLDPSAMVATWLHRGASCVAVLGITAGPLLLWRAYGRVLLVLGLGDVTMLILAAVLLPTSFDAWGAWERVLLLLGISSLVVLARRIPSIEDAASATSAVQSRAATYQPLPSVNSAKP